LRGLLDAVFDGFLDMAGSNAKDGSGRCSGHSRAQHAVHAFGSGAPGLAVDATIGRPIAGFASR
jgi:hypothetical protein